MDQTPKEFVLENIICKLKENATNWETAVLPLNEKIDTLVQIIHDTMGNNETERCIKAILTLILNGLENLGDNYLYNINTVTKNYGAYICVLEGLCNEYRNAFEQEKIVMEKRIEGDIPMKMSIFKLKSLQTPDDVTLVKDENLKVSPELLRFP